MELGQGKSASFASTGGGGITMVSRAGQYYGALFMVSRGITQGYLLLPIVFNMVVDAVIRYWAMRVAG